MPKRELSKCREWERERRDRLKTCFLALNRVLPCYDPSIILSKLEILQRATAYITELKQRNKEHLENKSDSNTKDELKVMYDHIKNLINRVEQLANLLKDAGIKIPTECGTEKEFTKLKFWSNKISKEKAEQLAKEAENFPEKNKKKKSLISSKNSTVQNSSKKLNLKKVRVSDSKVVKRRKFKQKIKLNSSSNGKTAKNVTVQSLVQPQKTIFHCLPTLNGSSIYVTTTTASSVSSTPFTGQSLVVTNTANTVKPSIVTNTQLITTPIMTAGINQRNPSLSSLGPGTLILANGNIVPVLPPPSQTLFQPPTIFTAIMNPPNPKSSVVVIKKKKRMNKNSPETIISNINKSETAVSEKENKIELKQYQKIVPKLAITKTTTINKVPIPALISNFQSSNAKKSPNKIKSVIVKKKLHVKASITKEKKENEESKSDKNPITNQNDSSEIQSSKDNINDSSKSACDKEILSSDNVEKLPEIEKEENNKNIEMGTNQLKLSIVSTSIYSIDSLCKNEDYDKTEENNTIKPLSETNNAKDHKNEEVVETTNKNISSELDNSKESLESKETSPMKTIESDMKSDDHKNKEIENKQFISDRSCDKENSKDKDILQLGSEPLSSEQASVITEPNTKPSEALTLSLPPSEFSNDIFASLHVPSGSQHPESISPTAAFLLAFPLVSTLTGGKVTEVVDDDNSDSQHGTPTLLQIGNIENNKNTDNLASNLLSLDNIHSFFNQKEFTNYDLVKANKKPNETEFENENAINTSAKSKTIKETEQSVNKTAKENIEKNSFETFNQYSSNCIFSDMPLFQNTIANTIFSYEHTPVTYTISKQTDTASDLIAISKPSVLPFSEKKVIPSTVSNSSSYSYQQPAVLTSTTYNNNSYPKLNMNNNSNNNTSSINTIANSINYHSSSYYNPLSSANLDSNFIPNKYIDKHNVNSIYPNYSSNYSTVQNNILEPKSETSSIKSCNLINSSKVEHQTRNDKTKSLSLCQNNYTSDSFNITKEQYKYPEIKQNEKMSIQNSYANNDSNTVSTFKPNYSITSKNSDKNISHQKPLVNWMTTPDIRPTNDLLLPTFGKENENNQNVFYNNSNFASSNQTFYNTNNHNHYTNINVSTNLPVGSDSRKTNAIDPAFPVIPPPSYPRVSNPSTHTDENQFSWSPSKFPSFLDHSQHNMLVPSTLPTLIGDLALNTHLNQGKLDKNDCESEFSSKKKEEGITDKQINSKDVNRYKGKQLFSEPNSSNNFLSVSQLVDQSKNDMNLIRTSNSSNNIVNRKSSSTSRSSKSNTKHNKSASRVQKVSDDSKCLNNSSMMDMYINNKQIHDPESKHQSNDIYRQQNNSFRLSNISDINMNKEVDWAKSSDVQDNKSIYKNCSSNYSAEALIGHNVMQSNVLHSLPKTNRYNSSNHYGQTSKRSQITTFTTDAPFYSSVDYSNAEGSHYYSQASCNSFTYTTSTTVYQPSNFITSTSTSNSNFVNTPGIISDLEAEYNTHLPVMSSSSNLHTSKDTIYNKMPNNKTEQRQISNNLITSTQEKRNHNYVHNSTNKRANKRKQFSQDTSNLPGIADIGFLPMPTINSPMITEDPFHSHSNFYNANASQLYHSNNSQNSLYSKSLSQPNHDLSTSHSCNLLPTFSTTPVRNNILSTQLSAPSPTIASAGTSLTNFNLSTIFPEINKPGNISLPSNYDPFIKPSNVPTNTIQPNTNFSNVLQGQTTPQVNFGNKPYYNSSEFHHKVSTSQFHN